MNPISIHDSNLLLIDSANRTFGESGSDFTVHVPNSVNVKGVIKIVPQLITFPHLFPNVRQTSVSTLGSGPGVAHMDTFTLESKWYTHDDLVTKWNSHPGNLGMTLSYDVTTGLFSLTADRVINGTYTSCTIDLDQSLSQVLGFKVTSITFNSSATVYLGDFVSNLGGPTEVLVLMSEIANGNMVMASDGKTVNCLACVPIGESVHGSVVSYQPQDIWMHDIDFKIPVHINVINIKLCDSQMRPLTLPPNHHVKILLKVYHIDSKKY